MIRKFIDEINKISRKRSWYSDDTELYIIDNYQIYLPTQISISDIVHILDELHYDVTVYKVSCCVIHFGSRDNYDIKNSIPSTRAVSALIMNNKGEILVEDHVKLQALTLPGGKLDTLSADKYETLERELYEELGIKIHDAYFNYIKLNYIEYPAESGNYSVHEDCNFIVDIKDIEGEIVNKEPDKHKSIKWMSIEELLNPELKLSVVLQEALIRLLCK